jgi:hypothetical protein
VFVILGDLTKLNCDYWLGPTGAGLDPSIQKDFPRGVGSVEFVEDLKGLTWKQSGFMGPLRTYGPWPPHLPQPFSIGLHSRRGENASYIAEIVRFVRAAAYDYYHLKPMAATGHGGGHNKKHGKMNKGAGSTAVAAAGSSSSSSAAPAPVCLGPRRIFDDKVRKHTCPLIAVPLLGTGSGGNYLNTGKMAKALLPVLYHLCNELFVDVAVITIEEDVYKLVQACRNTFMVDLQKRQKAELEAEKLDRGHIRREAAGRAPVGSDSGAATAVAIPASSWFGTPAADMSSIAEGIAEVVVGSDSDICVDGLVGTAEPDAESGVAGASSSDAPEDPFGEKYSSWRYRPFVELAKRGAPRGKIAYAMEQGGCDEEEVTRFLNIVTAKRELARATKSDKGSPNAREEGTTAGSGDSARSSSASSAEASVIDLQGSMSVLETISGLRYLSAEVIHKKIPFLVAKAANGELSLFIGAGASMGAGLPSWGELLDSIAREVGIDGDHMEEFNHLDYYTKAAVLEHRINKHNKARAEAGASAGAGGAAGVLGLSGKYQSLSEMVAEKTTSSRYSVVHALLAAMPVSEVGE